jgi:hypothetical protein
VWRVLQAGVWLFAKIRAYDEYSDEDVELQIGQLDPNNIQGLLIDFRYVARDREMSRRSVLCSQCGWDGNRLYVRGYCAFREELRTFRVDRMADVIAIQGEDEMPIEDTKTFLRHLLPGKPANVAACAWRRRIEDVGSASRFEPLHCPSGAAVFVG